MIMRRRLSGMWVLFFIAIIAGFDYETEESYRDLTEYHGQAQIVSERIADLIDQETKLENYLMQLQADIFDLQETIATITNQIRTLTGWMNELETEIQILTNEITTIRDLIATTDQEITDLVTVIARRMRAAQRLNNSNSTLTQLTTAQNLNEIIQIIRHAQRTTAYDSALIAELQELIALNDTLYETLQSSLADLEARNNYFLAFEKELQTEQAVLTTTQTELLEKEQQLQDQLDTLYAERQTEEERLAMILAIDTVFMQRPPVEASGLAHPMPGAHVTSEFGPRWGRHHAGIDLIIPGVSRVPILAAADGVVTLSGWTDSMGNWVIIAHNIDGERVDTVYSHLRYNPIVSVYDLVTQGQVIGIKGNTGHSYGPHLHFEVHPGGFSWRFERGEEPRLWIDF